MKPEATQIIAKLPSLSRADLLAVHGAATALLGPQAAPNEQAATPLFKAITRALGLRRGFGAFQGTAAHKQFRRGEEAINAFLAEAFPSLDQRLHTALLALMIDCLVDNLKARHVPVSLSTVCAGLEQAPQALRDAFPGYLESAEGAAFIVSRLKSVL
jgi:hypothetical protein